MLAAIVLCVGSAQLMAEDDESAKDNAWDVRTGLAYDSNIYRAPSGAYFDEAAAATVNPSVHSGLFVPLRAKGKFVKKTEHNNRLIGKLSFKYDKYLDSKYSNADKGNLILQAGNEHVYSRKKSRERKLFVGFKFKKSKESYLDRDTGDEKLTTALTDISDRYQYQQTGLFAAYESRLFYPQYKLKAEYFSRSYKRTVVKEYDYDSLLLGGEVKFRLARFSKLKLNYDLYTKDYDQRQARDANGTLSASVSREYWYHELNAQLRQKLSKALLLRLNYQYKMRQDQYVGYYDYDKHKLRIRADYKIGKRQLVRVDAAYWSRDYPNAFAYDLQGQDQKKYRGSKIRLLHNYQWDKGRTLITQWDNWNENTTDSRYQFDRNILWLLIRMEL